MNQTETEIFHPDSLFLKEETRKTRWAIPYHHECLNARVNNLLVAQKDCIKGKKVLDLASHIGTFSYAALKMGAKEVVGVEIEKELVEKSLRLFRHHQVDPSRYRFEQAEILSYLERNRDSFDTVLCFGLLYYLADPYRLLELLSGVGAKTILLDTFTAYYAAIQGKEASSIRAQMEESTFSLPLMIYILTQPDKPDYTLPKPFIHKEKNLVLQGLPTKPLLETFFDSLGWEHKQLDWSDYVQKPVHWMNLISAQDKKASHWADLYATEIRISYRLTVEEHRKNE